MNRWIIIKGKYHKAWYIKSGNREGRITIDTRFSGYKYHLEINDKSNGYFRTLANAKEFFKQDMGRI